MIKCKLVYKHIETEEKHSVNHGKSPAAYTYFSVTKRLRITLASLIYKLYKKKY